MLHCQGKPAEIFSLSWVSLHHIFADGFQGIFRRILIIALCQCLINTFVIIFLISGKICKAHYQLLCKKVSSCREAEYLPPEAVQPVKKSHVLADDLPCFQIEERTPAALAKLLFQHK